MVCSWALVLIHQDSGCPSKVTCEQDAREKTLAKQQGLTGLHLGSLAPHLSVLAPCIPTHSPGSRAAPRPSQSPHFGLVLGWVRHRGL